MRTEHPGAGDVARTRALPKMSGTCPDRGPSVLLTAVARGALRQGISARSRPDRRRCLIAPGRAHPSPRPPTATTMSTAPRLAPRSSGGELAEPAPGSAPSPMAPRGGRRSTDASAPRARSHSQRSSRSAASPEGASTLLCAKARAAAKCRDGGARRKCSRRLRFGVEIASVSAVQAPRNAVQEER
jgi:hypothetical protein